MLRTIQAILLALVLFGTPSPAAAAIEAIATDAVVKYGIADTRRAILDILELLNDSISGSSFRIRTDLQVLISELDNLSRTVLDKTFSELNKQQADLLRTIRAGAAEINEQVT